MNLEDLKALLNTREAIGAALSLDEQLFVSAHYRDLASYLKTGHGRAAVQTLVRGWQEQVTPKVPPT